MASMLISWLLGLAQALLCIRLPEDFSKRVVFDTTVHLNSRINPNTFHKQYLARSIVETDNHLSTVPWLTS
jgi:hypothetical protein